MKFSLVTPVLTVLAVAVFLSLVGCSREEASPNPTLPVSTTPNQIATTSTTVAAKAVGQWQLVTITSGWTGKNSPPVQSIELVIDNQLQAIYYEEGKEVLRYKYLLRETPSGIRYSVTQQTGKATISMQSEGNFRVNNQQLTIGDTGVDGNDYTFERK